MVKIKFKMKLVAIFIAVGCGLIAYLFYAGFFRESKTVIENEQPTESVEILPISQSEVALESAESAPIPNAQDGEEKKPDIKKEAVVKNELGGSPSAGKNDTNGSEAAIVNKLVDFGYQKKTSRNIDTIILHSSYDALGADPFSVSGIISEYREYGVAAHYLIDREGVVYQLVADNNVAYHAGISSVPDGRTGVNEFSIGIEIMNTKEGKYTEKQYGSLNGLLAVLKGRYEIKYVLGHNQIAPGRKDDPWNFQWNRLR